MANKSKQRKSKKYNHGLRRLKTATSRQISLAFVWVLDYLYRAARECNPKRELNQLRRLDPIDSL